MFILGSYPPRLTDVSLKSKILFQTCQISDSKAVKGLSARPASPVSPWLFEGEMLQMGSRDKLVK